MKRYTMTGKVMTYLHVGSGEQMDPLEYFIKNNTVYVIDTQKFISSLASDKREEFIKLIDGDKMFEIRTFIRNNAKPDGSYVLYRAGAESSFLKEYEENVSAKNSQSGLLIDSFIRQPGGSLPYVPGSSIKGAIRTAVLAYLDHKLPDNKKPKEFSKAFKNKDTALEGEILDCLGRDRQGNPRLDIMGDPFRYLKVFDSEFVTPDPMQVRKVKNYHVKKKSLLEQNSFSQTYEVAAKDSVFVGELAIFDDERRQANKLKSPGKRINQYVDLVLIVKACDYYYSKQLKEELQKARLSETSTAAQMQKGLMGIFSKNAKGPRDILIRFGKFSQLEYVTLPEYKFKKEYGRTRSIIGGMPPGWVWISFNEKG